MRDGTRQLGDARRADARPADEVRPPAHPEPDISERITLIEFVWSGLTGTQPVILVSREWLQ